MTTDRDQLGSSYPVTLQVATSPPVALGTIDAPAGVIPSRTDLAKFLRAVATRLEMSPEGTEVAMVVNRIMPRRS